MPQGHHAMGVSLAGLGQAQPMLGGPLPIKVQCWHWVLPGWTRLRDLRPQWQKEDWITAKEAVWESGLRGGLWKDSVKQVNGKRIETFKEPVLAKLAARCCHSSHWIIIATVCALSRNKALLQRGCSIIFLFPVKSKSKPNQNLKSQNKNSKPRPQTKKPPTLFFSWMIILSFLLKWGPRFRDLLG